MSYQDLLPYCETEVQRATIEALIQAGSHRGAAKLLGRAKSTVTNIINRIQSKAARKGQSPEHNLNFPLAEFEKLKGRSALVDERTGKTVLQWYKTTEDTEKLNQAIVASINALAETEITPRQPKPITTRCIDSLLSCYVLTDYHLGMLAWHEEGGANWNLKIAEQTIIQWIDEAIEIVPNSKRAVLAELGDFMHFDGLMSVTPTSQNVLDADSRFPEIVSAATRIIEYIINRLLEKHEQVDVLLLEGNHDLSSSVWMRAMFNRLYQDEPRVNVETSPKPYYCVEHGKTSLFFHHGHLKKPDQISEVFAGMFREVIGRTKYSYAHMGHLHHSRLHETPLMIVEQHQTLSAKDAHASRHGYMADRAAQVITYHADDGEIGRVRIRAR